MSLQTRQHNSQYNNIFNTQHTKTYLYPISHTCTTAMGTSACCNHIASGRQLRPGMYGSGSGSVLIRVRVGTGPNLSQSRTRPDFENTLAQPDRDRSGLLKLWDPTRPSKIPLIPETDRNPTELPGFGPRFLYVMWGTLETVVIMIVSYYILHWNISKVLVQTFAMYH